MHKYIQIVYINPFFCNSFSFSIYNIFNIKIYAKYKIYRKNNFSYIRKKAPYLIVYTTSLEQHCERTTR